MILHCAYAHLFYVLVPIMLAAMLYRWFWYKSPHYKYPLTGILLKEGLAGKSYYKTILYVLRTATLASLMFLITRPQWVDENSKVNVEGVDIVIALDLSGSMMWFDDIKDQRPRVEVAKNEAIRFIEKRTNDPIGLVIFGKEALSRCPLTLDKNILKDIVAQLEVGTIDPDGTWLGTGLATAVNRLRTSKAKSKIIILLTDGAPTPNEKITPMMATEMAAQLGIKVYAIAIGNENGGFLNHPFGIQRASDTVNIPLLKSIAEKTGGQFFRANNAKDMRVVYNKIDALERTAYQTNIFHRYYEAFSYFIWIVLLFLGIELIGKLFVWRGV